MKTDRPQSGVTGRPHKAGDDVESGARRLPDPSQRTITNQRIFDGVRDLVSCGAAGRATASWHGGCAEAPGGGMLWGHRHAFGPGFHAMGMTGSPAWSRSAITPSTLS